MTKTTALIFIFIFSYLGVTAQETWLASTQQLLNFVENKGQVVDQKGNSNSSVRFIFADRYFNLQLKESGFSYELFEEKLPQNLTESGLKNTLPMESEDFEQKEGNLQSNRIDVKVVGANAHPQILGESSTGTVLNFYTSNCASEGITGVQSFEKVRYKNIYPGVDLVFSAPDKSTGTTLKYEWIVSPGADASKISLLYEGATAMIPVPGEGFKLLTRSGIIEESKVIAFTAANELPVSAAYHFDKNKISYKIERDYTNTIVIDPNILWTSYFGGNLSEDINNGELAVDKQSKVIVAGSTLSTLQVASTGAYQTTYGGGYHDAFVAKFTTVGKLSWATYYGSSGKDEGHAVATDADNNIYLGGLTTSQNGISTPGTYQASLAGGQDAFLVKFNDSGIRQWATYFGGSIQDEILDLDCDKKGNIYFSGYTVSPDKIATPGAH
ncbi:MAG: SBBP repeat-containing protein, partial [Chitinophagales bacterium]